MRTKLFSCQVLVWVLAMLILGLSSCSVKPQTRQSESNRNKAIVDLQKSDADGTKDAKSNKRTRTTASSRRSRDQKKSAAPKKVETAPKETETVNLANNSTQTAKSQTVSAQETSQAVPEVKPQASQEVVQLSEAVKNTPRLYRLGYGDVVSVKFFHTPEYNETVTVRPDGHITLQQVGDLYVAGKTTEEIDSEITAVFSQVLQNPQVTVIVRQFGGQQCYVMGEVEKPGVVPVAKGMTLMRAIAAAGGPKKTAKMSSIILIRSEDFKKAEASRLDLSMGHLKEHMETDLSVQAYDVVYVPKTFIADVGAFMSQIYDIVLPPFDAWARYEYWYKH